MVHIPVKPSLVSLGEVLTDGFVMNWFAVLSVGVIITGLPLPPFSESDG